MDKGKIVADTDYAIKPSQRGTARGGDPDLIRWRPRWPLLVDMRPGRFRESPRIPYVEGVAVAADGTPAGEVAVASRYIACTWQAHAAVVSARKHRAAEEVRLKRERLRRVAQELVSLLGDPSVPVPRWIAEGSTEGSITLDELIKLLSVAHRAGRSSA